MEHSGYTAEQKEGSRRLRRAQDSSIVEEELALEGKTSGRATPKVFSVASFGISSGEIDLPRIPFVLLVAASKSRAEPADLGRFAEGVIEAGVAYVCCWGEQADSLETAFDLRAVERDITLGREHPLIMTTCHENEPLSEAAWFWLHTAWPAPEHGEGPFPHVAICVGDEPSAERLLEWTRDPPSLDREAGLEGSK